MQMNRRHFLAAAAATAGAYLLQRPARAAPWGTAPTPQASNLLLPEAARAKKVLEIFLYGGLGAFESFYVVEEYGRSSDPDFPDQQWYLFKQLHDRVFRRCGFDLEKLLTPFAIDALGMQVKLGPLVTPLRKRSDILERLRVLVHRHDLEPHEAAIPVALSGQRLGSARMAGIGSAVQRYWMDRDTSGRRIPYSYVLYPDTELSIDNVHAASAVGFHPGSSRPLDLRIQADSDLQAYLSRANIGEARDAYDALLAHYAGRAEARYTHQGSQLRSEGLADYRFGIESLHNADALQEVIPAELLEAIPGESCKQEASVNHTAMSIRMAAHLLTHPTSPARHVTVVDGGLIPASGGGGYDVHDLHLQDTSRNLVNTLTTLVEQINEPGEADPSKIDLDETLIILNTEFGRTPYQQRGNLYGTNHHPYGYVTAMFGGPIGLEQSGILGAIGPDGWADRYVTPIEARCAVLAAMGIYPFSHEAFAIGDLRDQNDERDGLVWLNEVVLGRKS